MSDLGAELEKALGKALDESYAFGVSILRRTRSFNDRTGDLRASFSEFGSDRVGSDLSDRFVGTGVYYGYFLEFGTVRIRPRRFVTDAREELAKDLPARVVKHIAEVLGR